MDRKVGSLLAIRDKGTTYVAFLEQSHEVPLGHVVSGRAGGLKVAVGWGVTPFSLGLVLEHRDGRPQEEAGQ